MSIPLILQNHAKNRRLTRCSLSIIITAIYRAFLQAKYLQVYVIYQFINKYSYSVCEKQGSNVMIGLKQNLKKSWSSLLTFINVWAHTPYHNQINI